MSTTPTGGTKGFTVLRLDNRGFGRSSWCNDADDWTVWDIAADCIKRDRLVAGALAAECRSCDLLLFSTVPATPENNLEKYNTDPKVGALRKEITDLKPHIDNFFGSTFGKVQDLQKELLLKVWREVVEMHLLKHLFKIFLMGYNHCVEPVGGGCASGRLGAQWQRTRLRPRPCWFSQEQCSAGALIAEPLTKYRQRSRLVGSGRKGSGGWSRVVESLAALLEGIPRADAPGAIRNRIRRI
eukprot:g12111.t1